MFVDGEWIKSSDESSIPFYNPAKGKILGQVPDSKEEDVDRAVDSARQAFNDGRWSDRTPGERARTLTKVADLLESQTADFARLESLNTGKSIKQSLEYDVPYSVDNIRFLAGASRTLEGKSMGEYTGEGTSGVRREPIGVVAVITPWNYPLMMAVWRCVPALATGNTVILKPASWTPLTALELAKLCQAAGIPKGVFNVITGRGGVAGERLALNPKVDMISFTGSTSVGKKLTELGAGTLKNISLELGGKAPFIVFEDANLDAAAEATVVGGLINNGQDCAAAARFYIHESVLERYQKLVLSKLSKVKIGDPFDQATDLGPLISEQHRRTVEGYIKKGIDEGGTLLLGGRRPIAKGLGEGYYIDPTAIFTENEESSIVKEEIFGPVLTILSFSNYDDVIARANNVVYGLSSSVWTKDISKALNATKDLQFGTVWVNDHIPVPSEMPWAGYKQSGHGMSLSQYALEECTHIKHVYFDLTGKARKSWYYQVYGKKDA